MNNKYIYFLCSILCILFILSIFYLKFYTNTQNTIQITQDGKTLYTINLDDITEKQLIKIIYENHYNILEIAPHTIRIIEADCPDKTCINMGYLQKKSLPIICLPHHLIIQYTDKNNSIDTIAN